ncbi:hypothetical protein NQ318_001513 [Aromia moschata]|uniref:Uncharacterized protein n=1 Tax=Aromia moschata TaxID=1265417 RepID=A0AAV8Y8F2_9CUCU|nr:hypothetical protein NQ318_001513 [Aromia moschata]
MRNVFESRRPTNKRTTSSDPAIRKILIQPISHYDSIMDGFHQVVNDGSIGSSYGNREVERFSDHYTSLLYIFSFENTFKTL